MNLPLLILPCLAATLALSTARTLPADLRQDVLRHDAAGKTPLTAAKMAVARGAGSACLWGCDFPPVTCHSIYGPDYVILRNEKQIWHAHYECRFAWTGTCIKKPDAPCNELYKYDATDIDCLNPTQIEYTTSSTCVPPPPEP